MDTGKNKLVELINGYFDGALSPDEMARLERVLASDQHAADMFTHAAHLNYMLEDLIGEEGAARETSALVLASIGIPFDEPRVLKQLAKLTLEDATNISGEHANNTRESTIEASGAASPGVTLGRFSTFALVVGIAAALLLALWIGQQVLIGSNPESLATQSAPLDSAKPLAVGEVRIDSGTARLRLPSVGYVLVDGPAEFELVNPMRLRLVRGRINVTVTEPTGHGFVVDTPNGEVTDLGTKFGVDATDNSETGLVVFDGAVDLRMPGTSGAAVEAPPVERLNRGDGVRFSRDGRLHRIMSISTGRVVTFERTLSPDLADSLPTIIGVSDNLRAEDTKRFYEIVAGGLREDVKAYVDRPYEWNGLDESGIPEFLLEADYIKTFNDDKHQCDIGISVSLSRAAALYILWDVRLPVPPWLEEGFQEMDHQIGLDEDSHYRNLSPLGVGPGVGVDRSISIWRRRVPSAGTVELGPARVEDQQRKANKGGFSMYGIAAKAINTTSPP